MSGSDGAVLATNVGATGALADFNCPGGIYCMVVVASNWNGATAQLEMLGPDGVTWVKTGTNTTKTANDNGIAYMPPCRYRLNVITAAPTGLYASIARVVG